MLIKCPECGKEVSDNAAACVHCGYPLMQKKEAVKKTVRTKRKDGQIVASNIVLGIFGLMMLCAVVTSNGGVAGNVNAAVVSWFLTIASICALFAIKKLNKIVAMLFIALFSIAILTCLHSTRISPAYLILEFIMVVNGLLTLRYFKKSKIL